jgi:hypothetical protein
VELEPDKATVKHRHPHDYVTVTIGYAELSNEVTGKEPARVTQNHGDVRYIEGSGPSHVVHNLAATTFLVAGRSVVSLLDVQITVRCIRHHVD